MESRSFILQWVSQLLHYILIPKFSLSLICLQFKYDVPECRILSLLTFFIWLFSELFGSIPLCLLLVQGYSQSLFFCSFLSFLPFWYCLLNILHILYLTHSSWVFFSVFFLFIFFWFVELLITFLPTQRSLLSHVQFANKSFTGILRFCCSVLFCFSLGFLPLFWVVSISVCSHSLIFSLALSKLLLVSCNLST